MKEIKKFSWKKIFRVKSREKKLLNFQLSRFGYVSIQYSYPKDVGNSQRWRKQAKKLLLLVFVGILLAMGGNISRVAAGLNKAARTNKSKILEDHHKNKETL